MGEVWRATDTRLGRDVAIKILPELFAQDADRMARFTREAQVLASLNHPNIAAIYGVEERVLIMELAEGPTLAGHISQGPMAVDEALPILQQLVDALEYAHEKNIVHRDLKPANIKVTPEGKVKLLDFGLAKALVPETTAGNPTSSPTLTMRSTVVGTLLGTAAYMAPEQARGQIVDKPADIWAFGVVVYEMLTARRLFDGPTISDTLAAVLTREPDWEGVPARLCRLLRLCLQKDPRHRLRDIGDSGAKPEQPLPKTDAWERPCDWSPDGRFLMYARGSSASKYALWVLFDPTGDPANRTATPYLETVFNTQQCQFSPDSHWVAYSSDESQAGPEIYVQYSQRHRANFRFPPVAACSRGGAETEGRSFTSLPMAT
jgi:serine/threonine protein kinase